MARNRGSRNEPTPETPTPETPTPETPTPETEDGVEIAERVAEGFEAIANALNVIDEKISRPPDSFGDAEIEPLFVGEYTIEEKKRAAGWHFPLERALRDLRSAVIRIPRKSPGKLVITVTLE